MFANMSGFKSDSKKRFVVLLLLPVILTSCLTIEKNVKYVKPAEISISKDIKTIAILTKGKYRDIVYDILFNVFGREEARSRFDLIDRKNLDVILKEQNLYNQDEFDDRTVAKLGELSGAQAIIIGELRDIRDTMDHGVVILQRRYIDGYSITAEGNKIPIYKYFNENIPSIIKTYVFTIDIRMIDITKGTLIHNEQKSYKFQFENYIDNHPGQTVYTVSYNAPFVSVFPEMDELIMKTGKDFANYFAKKVAPYSVNEEMSFEIISRDEINKKFIRFIDNDLYDEALEVMLSNLHAIDKIEKQEIRARHYYNLGCVYEVKYDFEKSLEFYNKAVTDDPTDLHLEALKAIKERIAERKKLDDQLKTDNDKNSKNDW
jgi:hypothetical protein